MTESAQLADSVKIMGRRRIGRKRIKGEIKCRIRNKRDKSITFKD